MNRPLKYVLIPVLLLCQLIVAALPRPSAQDIDMMALPAGKSLIGIQKIELYICPIDSDAEKDGLTRDAISTDLSIKLRQAGIPVVVLSADFSPKHEPFDEPGSPLLFVSVETFKNKIGLYAYNITVQLKQMCLLQRDTKKSISATTWSQSQLGTVGSANVRQVRELVKDVADKFIDNFLAANPKK